MKIAFFITTLGHGSGGHFYSFKTTVTALSDTNTIVVVNIGLYESPIVNSIQGVKVYNVYFNGLNFLNLLFSIIKIIKYEKPNIIHSFDIFPFLRIFSFLYRIPLINNKCGGPNPDKWFPIVRHLILYSKENLDYFKKNPSYRNTKLYFIPNRILKVKIDEVRLQKLKTTLITNGKVILRISRISSYYKESLVQAINLSNKLYEDGVDNTLVILGLVQEKDVLEELKLIANNNVIFINNKEFTQSASELINIADIVIGTGRGLMEAASLGKALLTPMKNSKHPVLLTVSNFENLFYYNFSERNELSDFNEIANYRNIKKIIIDQKQLKASQEFATYTFEQYFNIKNKITAFSEIYTNADCKILFNPFNLIYHIVKIIFFFTKAHKQHKKTINNE